MLTYRAWKNKETGEIVLRPEGTELRDTYWEVIHKFEASDRADAVTQFRVKFPEGTR